MSYLWETLIIKDNRFEMPTEKIKVVHDLLFILKKMLKVRCPSPVVLIEVQEIR